MIGEKLGVYEITAKLGEGGMGEVYRARDTKLGRDVALKVLPQGITADAERLARFEREARVLASLNHPNIGAIYGLEEAGSTQALVLELVEGPTLAERIAQGPMPIEEALGIARQIAEALELAHEQGVIHRDLKPANVKVRSDGRVKVLDFGLAKALDRPGDSVSSSVSMSPTLTAMTGQSGTILGTAAYMSPEQARGDSVDRRADVWAFGVVLFEMLSGRRPFEGRTVSDTLASVLAREPDFERLPADVPEAVRRLLRRCLEKDASKRLRDVVDGMNRLEEDLATPALAASRDGSADAGPAGVAAWQRPGSVAAIALAALGAGALLAWSLGRSPTPARSVERYDVSPRPPVTVGMANSDHDLAITPDGRHVVYSTGRRGSPSQLHVRDVESLEARPLLGDRSGTAFAPFVSPDGAWIGFSDEHDDSLEKVSILGGPVTRIGSYQGGGIDGASWGSRGDIVFGSSARSGLWRVPASGGVAEEITSLEGLEINHGWPHFLPDGRHVLFSVAVGSLDEARIELLDLDSGERRTLLTGGTFPRYSPSGHLLYAARETVWAVGFDADRLEITSPEPVPVLEGVVHKNSGAADFDLSREGSLVYVAAAAGLELDKALVWVDPEGREEPIPMPSLNYIGASLSPDGRRLAALEFEREGGALWIHDLERGTETVVARGVETGPLWTPDGESLVYTALRDGDLVLARKRFDGPEAEERWLTLPSEAVFLEPTAWSGDGKTLVGTVRDAAGGDLVAISVDGSPTLERVTASPEDELMPDVSPDGEWIAYSSNESGSWEIYVQRFPSLGEKQIVSTSQGVLPKWSADGKALTYRTPDGFVRVPVLASSPSLRLGAPERLFALDDYSAAANRPSYDVARGRGADGRLLMIRRLDGSGEAPPAQVILLKNWTLELERRER